MKSWNVWLETRRAGASSTSIAGYVGEELPAVGKPIDVGGSMATVTEISEGPDGEPLIHATRELE